jgi:hypothetical protein
LGLSIKHNLFALAFFAFSPAAAQNDQLAAQPRIYESFTVEDLTSFFAEHQFPTRTLHQQADYTIIEATTPGGGVFLAALNHCENGACPLIEVVAFFPPGAIPLDQANELHKDKVAVSTIIVYPDRTSVARKIILAGGVTRNSIGQEIGGFLYDVQMIANSLAPAAGAANVEDIEPAPNAGLLVDALSGLDHVRINAIGADAPDFHAEAISRPLR